jgi:Transposase DDE domain group 1
LRRKREVLVSAHCMCVVFAMANADGLLAYRIEVVDDDGAVTAYAGLPLVLETMRALSVSKQLEAQLGIRKRDHGATDGQKAEALVLLMAAGGTCVSDINKLRSDKGLERLLGRALPSEQVLRTYLGAFHDDQLIEQAAAARKPDQIAYIPGENRALQALGRANVALAQAVATWSKITTATLDHDATIQEAHKELAKAHYEGGRGYQPSVIYFVEADQVIGDEYRDGNVPAGMENLRLIKRGFASLPKSIQRRFLRGDSALYEEPVLKWLSNEERDGGPQGFIGFTISADMTKELRAACAAVPPEKWVLMEERDGETVFVTEVEFTPGDWPKKAAPLRYVAVKFVGRQLELDGKVAIKHLAIVSNRWDLGAPQLLRWHWEKAGTIEHVHDVVKNELGGATPPSGRFGANAAWFRFALLTYNVLSAMKQLALPPSMETARPKRMRFALFTLAARITSHAGSLVMKIGRCANQLADLAASRLRLARLALALA